MCKIALNLLFVPVFFYLTEPSDHCFVFFVLDISNLCVGFTSNYLFLLFCNRLHIRETVKYNFYKLCLLWLQYPK